MNTLIFFVAALLMATPTPTPETPREQIPHISNYMVYYGEGEADALAAYDLVIIQPETLTAEALANLRDSGTITVAYLSVGEVEDYRAWYSDGRVDAEWMLGQNGIWGSYYIDANQRGWRDLMVAVAGEYLEKGFDGVFLDTVDTVDLFPETREGMLLLIAALREAYPDALLIQNRGFSVLTETVGIIDAVMFEDLSTYAEPPDTYTLLPEVSEDAAMLRDIHEETGLPVLALDYVKAGNRADAEYARRIAAEYGFVSAVAEILLDSLPDYD